MLINLINRMRLGEFINPVRKALQFTGVHSSFSFSSSGLFSSIIDFYWIIQKSYIDFSYSKTLLVSEIFCSALYFCKLYLLFKIYLLYINNLCDIFVLSLLWKKKLNIFVSNFTDQSKTHN